MLEGAAQKSQMGDLYRLCMGRQCPIFDSLHDVPVCVRMYCSGSIGVFDRVGWVGCIGRSTSLHEVPDWESWSRLVHERVEKWCAPPIISIPYFSSLPRITFFVNIST